jgi:hypothetical protein
MLHYDKVYANNRIVFLSYIFFLLRCDSSSLDFNSLVEVIAVGMILYILKK